MGNRIKALKQEPRTKNQNGCWVACIFFGSWFLILGSFSAQSAEKVTSLNACTDELLLQLADPKQIVGVTRYRHSPQSEKILENHPEIKRVSGDVESIHQLKPSAIVAGPFSNPLLIEQLRKSKVSVFLWNDPLNWEDLLKSVKNLENLAGPSSEAAILRKKIFDLHVQGPRSKWAGKRALFWSAAGHVPGRGTFENTILNTFGIENAAAFNGYAFLSLEQVIGLAPDILWVTQDPEKRDSWSYDTIFHPALRSALPHLEYIFIPEEAVSCASGYTVDALETILNNGQK